MTDTPDALWMRRAVWLAARRSGTTGGNPTVGCVLVKGGEIVAEAVTAPGGRPHAEEQAVAAAGEGARGATAYVTLEPCGERSTGAPSCADRLLAAGVARVVLGAPDPSRYAAGRGPARLEAAGVEVTRGVLDSECAELLHGYYPADGRVDVSAELVRGLVAAQFPQWAGLPIEVVIPGGWDNRTFRLGEHMSVRLPSAAWYEAQVRKEQQWLPRLAPHLPLPIPAPLAVGQPADGYPFHWSVNAWIPGETAAPERMADPRRFAADLAEFLRALHRIDVTGGPPAGRHSFFRGGPLSTYDGETGRALEALTGQIDTERAASLWKTARTTSWTAAPVWVHGDIAAGNLLVQDGHLSAVIDFGQLAVGDPACDLAIAWSLFDKDARAVFRDAVALDAATWARGRAWALWKALIMVAGVPGTDPERKPEFQGVLAAVLADD